ncbi:hypothetical protein HY285_05715 [Candidatus Peregrinibacteria bacterium]|nr:hypothetical protein [Candidatus Peregrinibacteria bacterium]MBI3817004.1 hypothetical protein [Candidatus Peregrinibacteria bacterium]
MGKICSHCRQNFPIDENDLAFYEKVSPIIAEKIFLIPPPTVCPDCRRQRRFAFRNERHLYHRKCDRTGKQIISNFSPNKPFTVYSHDEWWSDRWDAKTYGQTFDFGKTFFEQFGELQRRVPQLSLSVWNSQNSDYCNYVGNVKDSYLIFGSVYSEDCFYGSPYYSKNCVDTLVVRECERCYECIDCRKLYECFYAQDCHSSQGLIFCFDLQGCSDCIGCAGLRRKQYCIFNEQHTKEEFVRKKAELDLCNSRARSLLKKKLSELSLSTPHRYMQSNQVENVSGNYVYECKNVLDAYYADRSEDCRYCAQVVDLEDCQDINFTEENELCYEYLGAYQNSRTLFSLFCNRVSDSLYCSACHSSRNLFGCVGMRNAEHCILNRQYTKEEYEKLVSRIIEKMKKENQYGEFFPLSLSPFGYNETVAQEYFQLTKDEANERGLLWFENQESKQKYMGPPTEFAEDIEGVDDAICEKILLCESTGNLYKVIPQELEFYREMHLPIPRICPNERHARRMAKRNPRKLWSRTCAKCGKGIETSYSPDRPEIVYCESCYLEVVY